MNVLVLGGNGFLGKEVIGQLSKTESITPFIGTRSASNKPLNNHITTLKIDSINIQELRNGLTDMDVVINCVTGNGKTIIEGARKLCIAAKEAGFPKIIHLSSQSVYGNQTGILTENTNLQDDLGWYGHAKIIAEQLMQDYAKSGGQVVILRPGCISGLNSPLWTTRITTWLQQSKLGDLGAFGDGWSNLVDVKDVAQAVIKSVSLAPLEKEARIYNLSAPDSPRWNQYFIDLGIATGATPIKRINYRSLKLHTYLLGIPVKLVEHAFRKLNIKPGWLPQEIPPSLLKVFKQAIKLDSNKATKELGIKWTPYTLMLKNQINKNAQKSI